MKTLKDIDKVKLQEKIDYIFDTFDFHKVAKVMKSLNWEYVIYEDGTACRRVPDETYLRKTARKLLNSMLMESENKSKESTATGGFEWSFEIYEDDEIFLRLIFALEELGD